MADSVVEAGTVSQTISKKEIISDLEDRYIEILRSKIARIESEVGGLKPKPDSSSAAEHGNSDDEEDADNKAQANVATDGSEKGPKSTESVEPRYHTIISEWNKQQGRYDEKPLAGIGDETPPEQKTAPDRAFTFRKIISGPDSSASEFDIIFPPLQKLLGSITYKYGGEQEVTKYISPYYSLVYAWETAQREATLVKEDEPEDNRKARKDLKEMLRIISTSSGDARLDRYFKNRETFLSEGTITHDALWTLFPEGTLIVGRPCHDEPQVFIVDTSDPFVTDEGDFEVTCFGFDWNGSEFNRLPLTMVIKGTGERQKKSITSLPFYPLEYYQEGKLTRAESIEKLKRHLIERGRKYIGFCLAKTGQQMFNYFHGEAYFHTAGAFIQRTETNIGTNYDHLHRSSSSVTSDHGGVSRTVLGASWKPIDGAVIVDFASYLTYQPPNTPILGSLTRMEDGLMELSPEKRAQKRFQEMYKFDWDRYPGKKNITIDDIRPEQLLCCPPRVLGYALKRKTWVQLLVKHLKSPNQADDSTFTNKLQLNPDLKDLISKSVQAHSVSRKQGKGKSKGLDDFAPEKGHGLVIMLYGPPGVGKTLAAESVAEMTRKPLLSVGVSDIGIDGDKVEINLQKAFALAGLWEAVLLFDEADIFLEARGEGINDLQRNAMVSVLLRVLEYYEGILILTTNRMRSLDIAVQSRIHLAIRFKELSEEQKKNIFTSFIEQLYEKDLVEDIRDVRKWVDKEGKKFDFNGRQIRNVVSTALGIAVADDRKLERDDLSSVARQTDEFKRDLATQEAVYRAKQISQRS